MRKHAFVALIMLIMSILAGCGGDGSGSTLVATTDKAISQADINSYVAGKTLICVSATSGEVISYNFGAGTTTGTLTKNGAADGTWSYVESTGEITITPASGTMVLKRLQVESSGTINEYWLLYDTFKASANSEASFKIFRFFIDQTNGPTAASNYIATVTTALGLTLPNILMGGTVQGTELNFTGNVDTITVTTLAGSTEDTAAGLVNTANVSPPTIPSVLFNHPTGVTTDGKNLYVVDTENHVIRKIVINGGETSTFAGVAHTIGSADNNTGTLATFSSPQGITCDGINLYVTDSGNGTIRKISLSGTNPVTTLAGVAGNYGAIDNTSTGASARFYTPVGITTDGTNLYVTDAAYHTIRKIKIATVSGTDNYSQSVTTLAGYPNIAGSTDATGTSARFNTPLRITTDGTNLYVTDFSNHTIRKVVIATGTTTTIAGSAGAKPEKVDGTGTISARFYYPSGITTDGTNLYISEYNDTVQSAPAYVNVIRKMVLSNGAITTLAGGVSSTLDSVDTADGPVRFSKPLDIVSNGTNLFVSNYSNAYTQFGVTFPSFNNIRKIGP